MDSTQSIKIQMMDNNKIVEQIQICSGLGDETEARNRTHFGPIGDRPRVIADEILANAQPPEGVGAERVRVARQQRCGGAASAARLPAVLRWVGWRSTRGRKESMLSKIFFCKLFWANRKASVLSNRMLTVLCFPENACLLQPVLSPDSCFEN